MFGNPETTPGGKALKFYASVRIDIRRKDTLKDAAGNAIGNHVKVKIVKNKVAPPFAEAEFDIIYNHGINKEGSILDVGIDSGVVEKKGAWLQFNGELIGQGKDAARKGAGRKAGTRQKDHRSHHGQAQRRLSRHRRCVSISRQRTIPTSLFSLQQRREGFSYS